MERYRILSPIGMKQNYLFMERKKYIKIELQHFPTGVIHRPDEVAQCDIYEASSDETVDSRSVLASASSGSLLPP